jgi:hypothetical protein
VTVKPAIREDVLQVIDTARRDVELAGMDKRALIDKYLGESLAFVGYAHEVPGCAWGVTIPSDFLEPNQLWLASTGLVDKHAMAFARGSAKFVDWAIHRFGVIGGVVLVDNTRSQRWLSWLGFTLGKEIELPLVGKVYPFQRSL